MRSAVDTAKKHGLDVMTAEANAAGDSATQIAAIENMINRGVAKATMGSKPNAALVQGRLKGRTYGRVLFNEAPFTFRHELLAILGH